LTFGYWDIDRSPSQTYEQILARGIYRFAEKLNFTASAGGEWRQYEGGAPDSLNPVFSLGGTYTPVDSTSVSLEGHEVQQTSVGYGNQNYTETGFSLSVRRRFIDRLSAALSASYYITDYAATDADSTANRKDNYYTLRLEVEMPFSERWVASLFYEYRGDSTDYGGDWENNRTGVKLAWRF